MTIELNIDIDVLTVGDLMDLENAKKVTEISDWLIQKAGAKLEDIRKIPAKDMRALMDQLRERLTAGMSLPKANGERSSSP